MNNHQLVTALRSMRHSNNILLGINIEGEDLTEFKDSLIVANYWIDKTLEKVLNDEQAG